MGIDAQELPAGLLTSGSTRRPDYVILTDLAPSIARLAGVDMDDASIEGRAVEDRPSAKAGAHRRVDLVDSEAAALFRE